MHLISKTAILLLGCTIFWQCQPTTSHTKEALPAEEHHPAVVITTFSQWMKNPQPLVSAHRGGPYPGFPENAIETFQNIADQITTVIECDVALTKDSVLVLMHDKTLDRTTTGEGNILEVLYADLQQLRLVDNEGNPTSYTVPTLDAVLTWGKGKAMFTLDVKRGVPFEMVTTAVARHNAEDYAAIITYRIEDAKTVHSLNPDLLISVSAGDEGALTQIEKSGIPAQNLLGFVGTREPDAAHYQKVHTMGIKTILGTLGNLDQRAAAKGDDSVYLRYIKNGANIIATDRPLEVAKVLQ